MRGAASLARRHGQARAVPAACQQTCSAATHAALPAAPPAPPCCRYYEPLAAVAPLEQVLAGPPLRKLLFMTHPEAVEDHLKPHWSAALRGTEAETMQAVPDMLGGWC